MAPVCELDALVEEDVVGATLMAVVVVYIVVTITPLLVLSGER